MSDTRARLQDIFREIFDDPKLLLRDEMTADDVEGWDSLAHVNLVIAVEQRFGIRLATAELSKTKEPGSNVGSFVQLIEAKLGAQRA
jgi:acyl carrier protein